MAKSAPVPIEIQLTHKGTYTIDAGMITVTYNGKSKTTQLGGSSSAPEGLAKIMLRELATGT